MKILTVSNTKILKGEDYGYMTAGLHLAPASLSGFNVCQKASEGCKAACLNTAGHGAYSTTQEARIKRTKMFFNDRATFFKLVEFDIRWLIKRAAKEGLKPCVRMNLTSDLPWHKIMVRDDKSIMDLYPEVTWYGYTKVPSRVTDHHPSEHITFSRSENNDQDCFKALANGINVAIVMSESLIERLGEFKGRLQLFNGDMTDLRFLDPKGRGGFGRIIFLKSKGKARKVTEDAFIMQSLETLQQFNSGFNAYLRSIKVKA